MNPDTHSQPTTHTSDAVIAAIKRRKIAPIPRWHFVMLNIGMWSSGVAAVMVGAVGVCMTIVVLSDTEFQALNGLPHPQLSFLRVLPYLWVGLLVAFVFLATRFVRHTRQGYTYTPFYVVFATVSLSVLGGWGLYAAGVGHAIVLYIDDHRPPLHSLFIPQYAIWEDPSEGALRGMVIDVSSQEAFELRDPRGETWTVDMSEASVRGEIRKNEIVHALGDAGENYTFHAQVIIVPERGHMMPPPHWRRMP